MSTILINEILRNAITNHYNLLQDKLNLIENSSEVNYLYYSISYHLNNLNHHTEILKEIANKF